jgi:hypothetical protein
MNTLLLHNRKIKMVRWSLVVYRDIEPHVCVFVKMFKHKFVDRRAGVVDAPNAIGLLVKEEH